MIKGKRKKIKNKIRRNFLNIKFNPYPIFITADVAQLVEQLIRNEQVIGSSPVVGSR